MFTLQMQQMYMDKIAARLNSLFANSVTLSMHAANTTTCDVEEFMNGFEQDIEKLENIIAELVYHAQNRKNGAK